MNLELKHIPLAPFDNPHQNQRSSGSKDDRISLKKIYLAKINGHWILGKFKEVWFGWIFNWFWSAVAGIQLDMIEDLYETNLLSEDVESLGYEVETGSGDKIRV